MASTRRHGDGTASAQPHQRNRHLRHFRGRSSTTTGTHASRHRAWACACMRRGGAGGHRRAARGQCCATERPPAASEQAPRMGDRGTSASHSTASRTRKAQASVLKRPNPPPGAKIATRPALVVEEALEASPLTLAVATAQAGGALAHSARRPCRRASTVTRRGRRRGSSHAPVPALQRASHGAMDDAGRGTPRLAQLHAQLSAALRSALKSPDLAVRPPAGRVEASEMQVWRHFKARWSRDAQDLAQLLPGASEERVHAVLDLYRQARQDRAIYTACRAHVCELTRRAAQRRCCTSCTAMRRWAPSAPAHAPVRPAQLSAPDPAAPKRGELRRCRRSFWRSAERRSWTTSSRCWTSCAPRSAGAPSPSPGAPGPPGVAAPSAGGASVVAAARAVRAASTHAVILGHTSLYRSRSSPGRRLRSELATPALQGPAPHSLAH
jgi:hypothetical protein